MRATWVSIVSVLGLGLVLQPWLNAGDGKKASDKKIAGVYRIVSGERSGKMLPKDEIDGSTVTFTENLITAYDKDRKTTYSASYMVSGEKITMTSIEPKKGLTTHGLVKSKGDQLYLIYSLPNEKAKRVGDAPTEFKTKEGQLMVVMERLEK